MQVFQQFHSEQTNLNPINEGRIVLIPKTEVPTSISDYRPISLINYLPKLISKVLANRMKPLLPSLINEHQTAFVQGRFIAENFLAIREVLHHVHRCASPALILKLDFNKAFDTLDWSFLLRVMVARGFSPLFIRWIPHLFSTSTSRILVNGQLSQPFSHKRGLRQGDPLSPFLFILAVDVLQQMTATLSTTLPFPLSNRISRPVIIFQYADDTVFIVSARGNNLQSLLLLIHCFSEASGLTVNLNKSSFVPLAIPHRHLQSIERTLRCKRQSFPVTYLGMPLSIKAPNREDLMPLVRKLEQRLKGWKARLISRARKLQLVRSVLSSIPTYFMSCFALPKWTTQRIDRVRRQFLWSRPQTARPIHLLNWRAVSLPLQIGGLGVPDLHLQNTSLLMRWWWRLYSLKRELWSTYASQIYAQRRVRPLILSSTGSFFWNSIVKLKPLFHSSVHFTIASGKDTSFWYDSWVGQPLHQNTPAPISRRAISVFQAKSIFHQLLPAPLTLQQNEAFQLLLSTGLTSAPDAIVWRLSSSGSFSVKSIYTVLSQAGKIRSTFFFIWKSNVTPSMRLFAFFLLQSRLLMHDVMQRRHLHHTPGCVMCSQDSEESAMHLFFLCSYAKLIWDAVSTQLGYNAVTACDTTLLTLLSSAPTDKMLRKTWIVFFITTTWFIWNERNNRIFRNTSKNHHILLGKILQEAALCLRHC